MRVDNECAHIVIIITIFLPASIHPGFGFQDRRQAIGYACDVPAKIEQRLFAIARQIQQELD